MIYLTLEPTPRHDRKPMDIQRKLDEQRDIVSRHEDARDILVKAPIRTVNCRWSPTKVRSDHPFLFLLIDAMGD